MNKDAEHLRYLSIGFYIYAGLTALVSLFPVIHVVIGIMIATGSFSGGKGEPPPAFMGYIFAGVGGTIIILGLSLAVLNFLTGRFLARRTRYVFCFVMAGLNCMFAPIGTLLGVFTIIVLLRDPVKEMFGKNAV